ncbi:HNH endonuclease signature motif containing protein [uncultured Aeromicrobium sp.]|uniref:HNH endonuclease signature motif containing protein n=1 Tax=uncultured Aeromicrobium sp. TaxID=337820 RepID=UPI0025EDD67A|nr:HNH endonuclease signature motif containing protein [uncultured Aeromicrobium sp.]
MSTLTRYVDALDRIAARVEINQPDDCWLWTGFINKDGYGRVGYKGDRSVPVYRAVFDLVVGPIPEGLVIDHRCHTDDLACPGASQCLHRRCVNPDHLELVTAAENTLRGNNTRKTHCVNGHEYTPENTYKPADRRYCVACYTARHGRPPVRRAVA